MLRRAGPDRYPHLRSDRDPDHRGEPDHRGGRFDLWAEWCAPCRELDDKLAALAGRYPDRFAVRKLDVVDTDSAAWLRYLAPGSFELPHIKVYGPDGALLFEKTAPPDELVKAVEALVR